jgi:hypothetical protein
VEPAAYVYKVEDPDDGDRKFLRSVFVCPQSLRVQKKNLLMAPTFTSILDKILYLSLVSLICRPCNSSLDPRPDHMRLVVVVVAQGEGGFPEYFRFLCKFLFHQMFHTHPTSSFSTKPPSNPSGLMASNSGAQHPHPTSRYWNAFNQRPRA